MTESQIKKLIGDFLDGTTTPAQEEKLYAYFATHSKLPAELERYRAMFGWYSSLPRKKASASAGRRLWWSAAAAIAVLAAVGIALVKIEPAADSELYACYRGSYVICNGKKNTDLSEIYRQVALAEATADSLAAIPGPSIPDYEEDMVDAALSGIKDPVLAVELRNDFMN